MSRRLRMTGLEYYMDEGLLENAIEDLGYVVGVDVSRRNNIYSSDGYATIKFGSHEAAAQFLQLNNGQPIPRLDPHVFQLAWAEEEPPSVEYYCLHVDVANAAMPLQSNQDLMDLFSNHYQSVIKAEIIGDAQYGIVVFSDKAEHDRAIVEMPNRGLKVGAYTGNYYGAGDKCESSNPTEPTKPLQLFVHNLDPNISDEQLKFVFDRFGDSVTVHRFDSKKKAVITFIRRECAEKAMSKMNGTMLGNRLIGVKENT